MLNVAHSWDLNQQEAVKLQRQLARQVRQSAGIKLQDIATVAGIDTHYHQGIATAAAVTVRLSDLAAVDQATAARRINFPYVPGLLFFREGPVVLDAVGKLTSPPDVLMIDGQGIAHPRRFGLACHVGLLADIPSIGCAKSWLSGYFKEPPNEKGRFAYLGQGKETIGAVLRTRTAVKPIYVSVGHRINLQTSIRIVLKCCRRYRIPEPIRLAHALARRRAA